MLRVDSLQITPELLALISELDEFKGAWRLFGTLAPDRLKALERMASIECVGSSLRIEGGKFSDRDVERLLRGSGMLKTREEQEVVGYAEVLERVALSFDAIPVTEAHLKQLHHDLLRHSEKDARHRGDYKSLPNNIAAFDAEGRMTGVVFETASPFDTARRMRELLGWLKETRELGSIHPLITIAAFIASFLAIHPFQDGNGHLSRILTTLLLLQEGYHYAPYSSLESVIESNKEGYFLALRQTQTTIRGASPDWHPWLIFFMRTLQQQKCRLSIKVERERNALAEVPELAVRILDYARDQGRVRTRDMVREFGASPNTLKATFSSLVKKGILVRHGGGRSTWYSLP